MEKYLPYFVIGGLGVAALYAWRNRVAGQTINRIVPIQNATPFDRDPYRVAAFEKLAETALGAQRLATEGQSIGAQLELGKYRLQEARDLATLQANSAVEIARINAASRQYDADAQMRAINASNIARGISALGSLLGGLLGGNRSGSGGSGGSGGSFPSTPPTFPGRVNAPNRPVVFLPDAFPSLPVPPLGSSGAQIPVQPGFFSDTSSWFDTFYFDYDWPSFTLPWPELPQVGFGDVRLGDTFEEIDPVTGFTESEWWEWWASWE